MPYITIKLRPKEQQISFDDILNGIQESVFERDNENTHDTRTDFKERTPEKILERTDILEMINTLRNFNSKYKHLIETEDKSTLNRSFKIPKRSGGLRQIDAPQEELMAALKELKYIFENKLFASYHTSAFAYVKGRSTIDAVRRHQRNKSRWFLKLDFHNFFGSTTPDFVMSQLKTIFPFNEIIANYYGKPELEKALSLCFLNGGLPQGTPISPTLTNLMMIPADHCIAKVTRDMTPHLVYTRYADDIILSSDISFKWSDVQEKIIDIIKQFNAPFTLNTSKTRYGSSAGRNWNLGVMLNANNEITVGHARKKAFKAMIFSFMNDFNNNIMWDLGDVQHFLGLISYYKMVEPKNIDNILKTYFKLLLSFFESVAIAGNSFYHIL